MEAPQEDTLITGITLYLHENAQNVRIIVKLNNDTISETCSENDFLDNVCANYTAGIQNISLIYPDIAKVGGGTA